MNGIFIGLALGFLLLFFIFIYLKAFVRKRTSLAYILEELQEEVIQLEADIDVKTEQNLQLLEEKIRSLREVCNEAERKIALLNRELEKQNNETKTLEALSKKPPEKKPEAQIYKKSRPLPAANVNTGASPLNITLSHEKLAIKPRPIKERIAELQKAGFAPELIAKRLELNPGEVQFYFNLAGKPELPENPGS